MRALLVPILYVPAENYRHRWYEYRTGTKKHRRITSRNATQPNSAAPVDETQGRHIRSTWNSSCRGPARRREAVSARDGGAVEP